MIIIITLSICSCQTEQKSSLSSEKIVVDDLNREITITETPKRIISLAPNLTEMIFSLDEGEKIVGNTLYCNYPEKAKKIEKVGDLFSVNFEKILELNADLILITVEGNSRDVFDKLLDLNQKLFVSNPRNFEGIKKTFSDLGDIFGKKQFAAEKIENWEMDIGSIKSESYQRSEIPAFLIISVNPLMTAGKSTFMHEFFNLCNLKNIAEDSPVNYPILSREKVLMENPRLIIVPNSEIGADDLLSVFPEWENLDAVKKNQIIEINADIFFRPGPRFVSAAMEIYDKINTILNRTN